MSEQDKCETCKEVCRLDGYPEESRVRYCKVKDKYINLTISARQQEPVSLYKGCTECGDKSVCTGKCFHFIQLPMKALEDREAAIRGDGYSKGYMDGGAASTEDQNRIEANARKDERQKWRDGHTEDLVWMTPEEEEKRIRDDERNEILDKLSEAFFQDPVGRHAESDEVLLMDEILDRIESLRATTPITNDHDYQCGDNCHGECSGEYDGKIHCPETGKEKGW